MLAHRGFRSRRGRMLCTLAGEATLNRQCLRPVTQAPALHHPSSLWRHSRSRRTAAALDILQLELVSVTKPLALSFAPRLSGGRAYSKSEPEERRDEYEKARPATVHGPLPKPGSCLPTVDPAIGQAPTQRRPNRDPRQNRCARCHKFLDRKRMFAAVDTLNTLYTVGQSPECIGSVADG